MADWNIDVYESPSITEWCRLRDASVTKTISAGDWNDADNWDNGVPTVDQDCVVDHAMSIGASGATFKTADINATVTITANCTITIADGGSIDCTGGEIDTDDNDPDVTFTASVGSSNFTWNLDNGSPEALDFGTGTITFKYATLIGDDFWCGKSGGTVNFSETCTFEIPTADNYFYLVPGATFNFTAGKTYYISDGTNIGYLMFGGTVNVIGTSGSHITFDGRSEKGGIKFFGSGSLAATVQWVDMVDCYRGFYYDGVDTASDSVTLEDSTVSSCSASYGIYFVNSCSGSFTLTRVSSYSNSYGIYWSTSSGTGNTYTLADCKFYSNTNEGVWISGADYSGATWNFNDCEIYSNTDQGAEPAPYGNSDTVNFNRCKIYDNAKGVRNYGTGDQGAPIFTFVNCLIYENNEEGLYIYDTGSGSKIFNCTVADNDAGSNNDANIRINLRSGFVMPITNTVSYGGYYGIYSDGVDDPVVTYTNCYGASQDNYQGMTDPTGTNGCISQDPSFVNAGSDDYSLDVDSPCINAGTSTGAPTDDIDEETRPMPVGSNPDMGCYEEQTIAELSVYDEITSIIEDVTIDEPITQVSVFDEITITEDEVVTDSLTTTTIAAGDWNTATNWNNGVPTVNMKAVVEHAMTIDGTGATFNELDNNSSITLTATATITIKDGGNIDNAGGSIVTDDNNITFKASSGVTKWSWELTDGGTWTDGTGEHHFENGTLYCDDGSYTGLNAGSYFFDEDMTFYGTVYGNYIRFITPVTFAANKTYEIYSTATPTPYFALDFRTTCTLTMEGGSGTEINLDDGGEAGGRLLIIGNAGLSASIKYVDSDGVGMTIQSIDTGELTFEDVSVFNVNTVGISTTVLAGGTSTYTRVVTYSNGSEGQKVAGGAGTITFNDCDSYSNTTENFDINDADVTAVLNRCESRSGTTSGMYFSNSNVVNLENCLSYENTYYNYYIGTIAQATGDMVNCTGADGASSYGNIRVNAALAFAITNCIFYKGKYCIDSTGSTDPTVTYTDVYGGTTSNYNGMTDPTGSNGNIAVDPLFTNEGGDDYSLEWNSPCGRTGDSASMPSDDIDGNTRCAPAMGCYRYCDTVATTTGNWSTGGTWDNGAPATGLAVGINVAVTIDQDIAFATLYIGEDATFDANDRIVTVDDAGWIEIASTCWLDGYSATDLTFKAKTGTTKWRWHTFDAWYRVNGDFGAPDGVDVHFENVIFENAPAGTQRFDRGNFLFDQDCEWDFLGGGTYYMQSACTFAAGKTFKIYNSVDSDIVSLGFTDDLTINGSLGNEITINSGSYSQTGRIYIGNTSGTVTIDYLIYDDCHSLHGVTYNGTHTITNSEFKNCVNGLNMTTTQAGATLTFQNCKFYSNSSYGIYVSSTAGADFGFTLTDCEVYSNTTAGVYPRNGHDTGYTLERCKIYGNGDGIFHNDIDWDSTVTWTNLLVYENTSENAWARRITTHNITNCTFADAAAGEENLYLDMHSGDTTNIKNTIVEGGNYCIRVFDDSGTLNVSYSNVYGAVTSNYFGTADQTGSNGNISADPKFADAGADDYSLDSDSPCIGTGTNTGAPSEDIDGNTRPMPAGTNCDMGCYEEQSTLAFLSFDSPSITEYTEFDGLDESNVDVYEEPSITENIDINLDVLNFSVYEEITSITESVSILDIVVEVGIVFESPSIEENIDISIGALNISVYEEITSITENFDILIPELNIDIYEDITSITEYIELLDLTIDFLVYEDVSIEENINLLITELNIIPYDEITITESVSILDIVVELGIIVQDVSIEEDVTILLGALPIDVYEEITSITENIETYLDVLNISLYEEITSITENIDVDVVLQISVNDAPSITEWVRVRDSLTTTTIATGDWNDADNWDNGIPTVDMAAIVEHAMTVDGTGATFNTLDNNSTITLTANQTWTIKDSGSIDNAGGTITLSGSNPDVTFTGSVGASNWSWMINSGTFTEGSGTITFEYITMQINNDKTFSGTYVFSEDCEFDGTTNGDDFFFDSSSSVTFTAGKTYTLTGNGTNEMRMRFQGTVSMPGTSGSHIAFNGTDGQCTLWLQGTNSLAATLTYVDIDDLFVGLLLDSIDTTSGDSITANYITITNCDTNSNCKGFSLDNGIEGTITFTGWSASSCYVGMYIYGDGVTGSSTITWEDCNFYSNSTHGYDHSSGGNGCVLTWNDCGFYSNTDEGARAYSSGSDDENDFNRCKFYGNGGIGLESDSGNSAEFHIVNCLGYENGEHGVDLTNTDGDSKIFNCTFADNGSSSSNIYITMTTGDNLDITNTICYGCQYGITVTGFLHPDPTVTYTCVYGASSSNYNGMDDQSGSNGNIDSDPKFKNASGDDYSLADDSPCLQAGTTTGAPSDDIDENSRPVPSNSNPEMGCYESTLVLVDVYDSPSISEDFEYAISEAPEPSVYDEITSITEWVSLYLDALNVEVNDSPSITEDIEPSIDVLFTSIYDEITSITESVSILDIIVEVGPVFEDVSIEENLSINIDVLNISPYEEVTIVEDITIHDIVVELSIYEDITIEENLDIYLDVLNFSLFEEITSITENIGLYLTELHISLYEEILAITEDITPVITELHISNFDEVTITESISILDLVVEVGIVFDTVTIEEDVTILVEALPLNIYEEITSISENIDIYLDVLNISIYDEVTVTEYINIHDIIVELSIYEEITIVENIEPVITELFIDLYEDITSITENFEILLPELNLSLYEDITITESVSLLDIVIDIGILYEDVTIIENLDISITTLYIDVYDLLSITENLDIYLDVLNKLVYEEVTVTEWVSILDLVVEVNSYDEVTITEVPTLNITELFLSVYDEVTIVEEDSISLDDIILSVYDEVTITEAITMHDIVVELSIYDEVTIVENLDILLPELNTFLYEDIGILEDLQNYLTELHISLFDLVTITESVSILDLVIEVGIVSEDITIIEDITVSLTDAYVDVYEDISVVENLEISIPELFISLYDELTITENFELYLDVLNKLVFETLTITESASVLDLVVEVGIVTDEPSITEFVNISLTELFINVYDEATIVEDAEISLGNLIISVYDEIVITEAITMHDIVVELSAYEDISIVENLDIYLDVLNYSVFEDIAITEAVIMHDIIVELSIYDEIAITENIEPVLTELYTSVFDTLTLTEYVNVWDIVIELGIFETISITEYYSSYLLWEADVGDDVGLTGALVSNVTIEEYVSLDVQAVGIGVNVYDAVTITEYVNVWDIVVELGIYETITIAEYFTTAISTEVDVGDDVGLTGALVSNVLVEESVTLVLPDITLSLNVFDSISLAENVELDFILSVYDSVSIAEAVTLDLEIGFIVFDSLAISEYNILQKVLLLSAFDTVTIAEYTYLWRVSWILSPIEFTVIPRERIYTPERDRIFEVEKIVREEIFTVEAKDRVFGVENRGRIKTVIVR